MIISRTPFRVSLFGGGTDYPNWFEEHGGAVLAGSIDRHCYLTCRWLPPFFEHRFRVVYTRTETCNEIREIQHPAVRGVLEFLGVERGVEIHHDGDLPARSGMGSSSSFTVGLLHALYALNGQMPSREQLAKEAIHIERDILKETVGCQDQILASYGGLNLVTFLPSGGFTVRPVTVGADRLRELSSHLMLVFTGVQRQSSKVAGAYVPHFDENVRALRTLREFVDEALATLIADGPIEAIGALLHESWQLKKSLSRRIANETVDDIYDAAREAGALGGKLLGAGGGGFLLLFVPPALRHAVSERLGALIQVPFEFEHAGSQVIFNDPRPLDDVGSARRYDPVRKFRELE